MHLRKKNSFLKRMRVRKEGQYRAKHGTTLDVNLSSAGILFPNVPSQDSRELISDSFNVQCSEPYRSVGITQCSMISLDISEFGLPSRRPIFPFAKKGTVSSFDVVSNRGLA